MYQHYESWHYENAPDWLHYSAVPVTAGNLKAGPGYEVRPRILRDYYLVWVRSGSGSLKIAEKSFSITAGDIFLLFPDIVHSYRTDLQNLLEMFWIGFSGVSASALVQDAGFTPEQPLFSCCGNEMLVHALEALSHVGTKGSLGDQLDACGRLFQFFSALFVVRNVKSPSVRRHNFSPLATIAHNYINIHYSDTISVADLCAYVGVSRSTLNSLFRSELGQSPTEYICYIRMKHAVSLLCQTALPIQEIAHQVGYRDSLYFSKVFSKNYGVSPSRFRELARNADSASF